MKRFFPPARAGLLVLVAALFGAIRPAWAQAKAPPALPVSPVASAAPASQPSRPVRLPKAGLWESTVVTDDGSGHRTAVTSQVCVKAAELSTPGRFLPSQSEAGMECETPMPSKAGATLSWTIACKSAEVVKTGSGKLSLSDQSYLGRIDLELRKKAGKPVVLKQGVTGKWLSAC